MANESDFDGTTVLESMAAIGKLDDFGMQLILTSLKG